MRSRNLFWSLHCELVKRCYQPVGLPGVVSVWSHSSGLRIETSRRPGALLRIFLSDGGFLPHASIHSMDDVKSVLDEAESQAR
jgi:hypothetical protein